ncbi:uncharacterized protein LOC116746979 isoform X1 [Phocoena sinus]|uniref:uncharacterized protein LOC116746979 isoform X1 n=1 Tax=Phocoena sinus TaxID=42100 RepID=UPI0013C4E62C|nr:uncharacterized protein LOC116746979 isoform X1 [Phocoena sinus]
MEITNGTVRNILFYPSLIHCSAFLTVWLTHLFTEVTMFSISVTDPPEWAPTRVPLPSVIGVNRLRLSLVQAKETLYSDQRMQGIAGLPPAKEEDVSPIPATGISPCAEVRKEKISGGRDRKGISGREMESFQKYTWGQDHPGWPAGTKLACVLSLVGLHSPSSRLSSPCTHSGVLPGKGGKSSAAAGLGLSSRLLRDASARSPLQ